MSFREPAIIYEDNHLIIINKPNGWLSQSDYTGDTSILDWVKNYLKEQKPNPYCQLVHRLDRPVSGLMILAKSSKALVRLQKIFQKREIEKIYWALVEQTPAQNSTLLTHWLSKNTDKNTVRLRKKQHQNSRLVKLAYKIKARIGKFYLLEINLLTGSKHQIRAQLAYIKCPIKGDVKYQYPHPNKDKSIDLHAYRLIFEHPVTKTTLNIKVPPPKKAQWMPFRSLAI